MEPNRYGNMMTERNISLTKERDRLKALNAELVTLAEDVIGFCVALREDKLCWRDHPDAGVLFSRARAVLAKARKED